jgi:hypothetical protein
MSITKTKQNISDFRVKMILADYIVILGNSESKDNDIIAFIADENLFEKILNEEDYELKADYIYKLITMKKIRGYADPRKDKIFNMIDSDITINKEIPMQYLNIIKELIYTKIVLQKLKNDSLLNKEVKKIIQDQEAIVFLKLYFYLTESTEIAELPKIKEIKDSNMVVDMVYKILIRAHDILRELNIDRPKELSSIVLRLKELLMSPEQVNINIDLRILGLIKIPAQIKKLKEEKKILEYDIEIIEQKIERKRVMETIPGELKNDPEVKELLKELEDKKERLQEIENKIKELKEELDRLKSNKEN